MANQEEVIKDWRKKRTLLLVNILIGAFSYGLTITGYYPTEYLYIKNIIKVNDPDLYFGISRAFDSFSGIVSTFISSYYIDKTKDLRKVLLITDILCIVGNIMYALHFSISLVLIGQLLAGTSTVRIVAGFGELARLYNKEELDKKVSVISAVGTIGLVLGPCLVYVFQFIDLQIGKWNITVDNSIGLFMALLFLFQLVLNYLTVENVSLLYNPKKEVEDVGACSLTPYIYENLEKEKNIAFMSPETLSMSKGYHPAVICNQNSESRIDISSHNSISPENNMNQKNFFKDYAHTLKLLLSNKHMMYLNLMGLFTGFLRVIIIIMEPIVGNELFSWEEKQTAIFHIIVQLAGALPVALLFMLLSKRLNYNVGYLMTGISLVISLLLFGILPYIKEIDLAGEIVLYIAGLLRAGSAAGSLILMRVMVANAVPENIQTTADAIRNTLYEIGSVLAGFTTVLPSNYLSEFMLTSAVFVFLSFIWFVYEWKNFINFKVSTA